MLLDGDTVVAEARPAVLGQLTASILSRPAPGDASVVAGWRLDADGRKRHSGAAVWNERGALLANAQAIWILLADEQHSTFNAATR